MDQIFSNYLNKASFMTYSSLLFFNLIAFVGLYFALKVIRKNFGKHNLPLPSAIGLPLAALLTITLWQSLIVSSWPYGIKVIGLLHLSCLAWILFQVKAMIFNNFQTKIIAKKPHWKETFVLLRQSAHFALIGIIALYAISRLGFDITGLLGGLGIGGMALAFASQEVLSSLFSYMTIQKEKQFAIGDWVIISDKEGVVEKIGLRSVTLRCFDNSVCIVPNTLFTKETFFNYSVRPSRRWRSVLNVSYDTQSEQMDTFVEGVKLILMKHPAVDTSSSIHAYFYSFGASSLDILTQCYLQAKDYSEELIARHEINKQIYRLAESLNVEFAFPTQTLHVNQFESHQSPDKTQDQCRKDLDDFFKSESNRKKSFYQPHKV